MKGKKEKGGRKEESAERGKGGTALFACGMIRRGRGAAKCTLQAPRKKRCPVDLGHPNKGGNMELSYASDSVAGI